MNAYVLAAAVLCVVGLGPSLLVASRGTALQRLVGLQLGTVATVAVLLVLSHGLDRSAYLVTALVLAVMAVAGALVFTRFLGRSL